MYAQVVVFSYQAPDIGYFTYIVPANLQSKIKIGQIVKVPFGKRTPYAFIVNTGTVPVGTVGTVPVKIKPITEITSITPILLPYQIKLLDWLSKYYMAPTINCLEAILPFSETELSSILKSESIEHSGKQTSAQSIVLVPSLNRLPETMAKYKSKNYLIFQNQLKTKEKFIAWNKMLSDNIDLVFGSRSAIFLPFKDLKKITIYDESDGAFKDARSPYFDTLTVAEKIQEYTKCQLEIIDDAPKLTTYFSYKNKIIKSGNQPNVRTKIISMTSEKKSGNKSPVSQLLEELIIRNHTHNGSTLLFLNKKKESGTFWCRSCQLNQFVEKEPKSCPACNSKEFFFYSLNLDSLKKEVLKIIPGLKVRIIAEGESYSFSANPQVDIATSHIFYTPNLSKYTIVAHVLADNVLNQPEFTAAQKTFLQVVNLRKLAKPNGVLVIQSYESDNLAIKTATSGDYNLFAKAELEQRKDLAYPPFSLLVKLTTSAKKVEKALNNAQGIVAKLEKRINSNVKILGPFKPAFRKKATSYNIILKYPLPSYSLTERENASGTIEKMLKEVTTDAKIIVEPQSLND